MSNPRTRLQENVTSATALIVIGAGLVAMAFSVPYFWLIFVVGLLVVVPLVGLLFGAEDWRRWDPLSDEFWEDVAGEETADNAEEDKSDTAATRTEKTTTENSREALQTLRDRYARGELTEAQFERKLTLLLETETLEDVEDRFVDRSTSTDTLTEKE